MPAETGDTRLSVKVTPNAARNEIGVFKDGVLQLKIAAPPVKGRANRELISFLSDKLGVSKSSLSIITGQTSRSKIVAVKGLSREDIISRLSP